MSEFFSNLVHDLLVVLESPDESFEPGETVHIKLSSEAEFTLEMAKNPPGLIVCWEVGDLPQSASRELWVKEALRWNDGDREREGTFSYALDNGKLLLHHVFSIEGLEAQSLQQALDRMHEKVMIWKEGLFHDQPPSCGERLTSSFKGPMMAFRP